MIETIDERLQDLERLLLKQSERIDALEAELALARRLIAGRATQAMRAAEKDAA